MVERKAINYNYTYEFWHLTKFSFHLFEINTSVLKFFKDILNFL